VQSLKSQASQKDYTFSCQTVFRDTFLQERPAAALPPGLDGLARLVEVFPEVVPLTLLGHVSSCSTLLSPPSFLFCFFCSGLLSGLSLVLDASFSFLSPLAPSSSSDPLLSNISCFNSIAVIAVLLRVV
jgi:hypothetical protein